jgi:hypothetical protein
MEEAGVLYLLAGAPRRWLEAGKKIEVKKGTTYFGKLNLAVESGVGEGCIQLSLELENHHPDRLKNVKGRIPRPRKRSRRCGQFKAVEGYCYREREYCS